MVGAGKNVTGAAKNVTGAGKNVTGAGKMLPEQKGRPPLQFELVRVRGSGEMHGYPLINQFAGACQVRLGKTAFFQVGRTQEFMQI